MQSKCKYLYRVSLLGFPSVNRNGNSYPCVCRVYRNKSSLNWLIHLFLGGSKLANGTIGASSLWGVSVYRREWRLNYFCTIEVWIFTAQKGIPLSNIIDLKINVWELLLKLVEPIESTVVYQHPWRFVPFRLKLTHIIPSSIWDEGDWPTEIQEKRDNANYSLPSYIARGRNMYLIHRTGMK